MRCRANERDAGGLRLAGQRDRRAGRRGLGLRGAAGRRAGRRRRCGRCSTPRATRTTPRWPAKRPRAAASTASAAGDGWCRHRDAGGAAAQAARRDRRASISSAPTGASRPEKLIVRPRTPACSKEGDAMTRRKPTPAASPLRRQGLGDARARADRSHRLGLAGPPLHRSAARFKFVPGSATQPRSRRGALRHVRGRVHPRGRPLHLRGAAASVRASTIRRWPPSARSSTTSISRTASTGARKRPASAP